MATPSLSYQNKFSTTLSSGITATDTTIPLTSLPTPSEGYLVLEPDSSTAWEEIYYTSKTGSAVVLPSVALGRGVGGSTAASHSSGATVRMDSSAELFTTLQDATALTGVHTNNSNYAFDFVSSGCVWSGLGYGSTLTATMASGVVYINGRRHTVASIATRTFTASKDTYIDLLYSLVDNIATPVYTEVANNAASPALAANSVRIGIIITGVANIAAATSVNQGQETMVLPIASSVPYAVTDSLGNLICPRDPNRKTLGYRQILSAFSTSNTTATQVTGLACPVIIPTGRKVKVSIDTQALSGAAAGNFVVYTAWDGVVASGTQIASTEPLEGTGQTGGARSIVVTPSATSKTYNAGLHRAGGSGNVTVNATATSPAFIMVELA